LKRLVDDEMARITSEDTLAICLGSMLDVIERWVLVGQR